MSLFGRSTLGLSYSIFLVDGLIAPAFPSNTARSGVLYPLAFSLASASGATAGDDSRRRVGAFLMFSGIVSLSLSSALWLTAMAANPLGTEIARTFGVEIAFGSWLVAACVPTLAAIVLMPLLLRSLIAPEINATPEAPAAARQALAALGPLRRDERIVLAAFVGMVALWASAATLKFDSTAVAFLGLGVLLVSGVLTLEDIAKEGDVLATFIWFAVLFTLSGQLNELGFMGYLGQRLAGFAGRTVAGSWRGSRSWSPTWCCTTCSSARRRICSRCSACSSTWGSGSACRRRRWRFSCCSRRTTSRRSRRRDRARTCCSSAAGCCRSAICTGSAALITACNMAVFLIVGTPWLMLVWR